jgi:hypothetical protein
MIDLYNVVNTVRVFIVFSFLSYFNVKNSFR